MTIIWNPLDETRRHAQLREALNEMVSPPPLPQLVDSTALIALENRVAGLEAVVTTLSAAVNSLTESVNALEAKPRRKRRAKR